MQRVGWEEPMAQCGISAIVPTTVGMNCMNSNLWCHNYTEKTISNMLYMSSVLIWPIFKVDSDRVSHPPLNLTLSDGRFRDAKQCLMTFQWSITNGVI